MALRDSSRDFANREQGDEMSAHPAAITEMKSVNATKVTMRHITRLHRRAILIAIVSSIWQKDTRISMHY